MFKQYFETLLSGKHLSASEMEQAMDLLMDGKLTGEQIAALITALRMNGEDVHEITGAARSMRRHARFIDAGVGEVLDIVGTGGDCTGTFNISTTSAFVIAGAGIKVAKHGNRSVSSKCGSADVLEACGFDLATSALSMECCIQDHGIGFLFAQSMHPAMKAAAPVRRELKVRTIFNILGPLANPAGARYGVFGVYDPMLTEVYAEVFRELGMLRAMVVYGHDGLDEISVSAPTRISELRDGKITTFDLQPERYVETYPLSALEGGNAIMNAAILTDVLTGREQGAPRAVVLLNSGAAIYTAGKADSIEDGIRAAADSIDSGAALEKFQTLIRCSKE
ncbi:MAG: anthranilate phosphoribosyltransferase [Victivallaceae bacterium]|nr:anthranilate phosphoribosyltransferase [Victivallaceae bacterium]